MIPVVVDPVFAEMGSSRRSVGKLYSDLPNCIGNNPPVFTDFHHRAG